MRFVFPMKRAGGCGPAGVLAGLVLAGGLVGTSRRECRPVPQGGRVIGMQARGGDDCAGAEQACSGGWSQAAD